MSRTLIVMVKEPRAGRVKTRLAQGIGTVGAAWWYRHQVAETIRVLRDPRWRLVLAMTPDGAGPVRMWPRGSVIVAQGGGDLGQRMHRLLTGFPGGPTVIIGSDIPGITPDHVWRAFRALGRADAVFGPAEDGGYWLVGLKNRRAAPPALFDGVRWSGPHALADTLDTLGGLTFALTDTMRDVDTTADLSAFRHDAMRGP